MRSGARIVMLDNFVVEEGFCRIAASPEDAPGDGGEWFGPSVIRRWR